MSIQESYQSSPEGSRLQRVFDIDTQEQCLLDLLKGLQAERAIILQTLGVATLELVADETNEVSVAETA